MHSEVFCTLRGEQMRQMVGMQKPATKDMWPDKGPAYKLGVTEAPRRKCSRLQI